MNRKWDYATTLTWAVVCTLDDSTVLPCADQQLASSSEGMSPAAHVDAFPSKSCVHKLTTSQKYMSVFYVILQHFTAST